MSDSMASYKYLTDFICLWLLFGIAMGVLRVLTDYMSKVKVHFLQIVDKVVDQRRLRSQRPRKACPADAGGVVPGLLQDSRIRRNV